MIEAYVLGKYSRAPVRGSNEISNIAWMRARCLFYSFFSTNEPLNLRNYGIINDEWHIKTRRHETL
jgi:hypothetical protein